jgi:hypothetical protein
MDITTIGFDIAKVRLCCGGVCHAVRFFHYSSDCRHAWLEWRPAAARIIGRVLFRRWATTCA